MKDYQDAILNGSTVAYAEKLTDVHDVMKLMLGNVPAK